MKKILAFAAMLLLIMPAKAADKKIQETVTPASDALVTYVGRTLVQDESVSFDWTATTIRVAFEGNYLAIDACDTHRNYYNVWIDKSPVAEPDKIIAIGKGDDKSTFGSIEANNVYEGRIEIVNEADFKTIYGKKVPIQHFVTIQKRTEGEQGTTTVKGFITRGKLLQAAPVKPRLIEFVGDSYTCGFGSENSVASDPFTPETENSSKSYAAIVSRYFNADRIVIAHSGMGIARNYNSNVSGWYMPERYTQTLDMNREEKWNAAEEGFKPDITLIYLGTNDFSVRLQPKESTFRKAYITLLRKIKENYGEAHPILCMSSTADENLYKYVHDAVVESGLKNVKWIDLTSGIHHTDDRDLGACSHPNYQGHKKIAHQVIPYIATLTGWELEDDMIK